MTDVYESCSEVYLPTRQIETLSNRRSYLGSGRRSGQAVETDCNRQNSRDRQVLPHRQQLLAASDARFRRPGEVEAQALLEEVDETLALEEKRDVVEGRDVVHGEDLLVGNVAEHGDLGHDGEGERCGAAAGDLRIERSE